MEQVILELSNIAKSFGDTQVLKKINLKVMQGEFVTLLGSSGCGKTTTLRIIAGLEEPDRGAVIIDGTDIGLRRRRTAAGCYGSETESKIQN